MASVSSLDQDMRKLRLDRYTPGAAKEVRRWIEDTLGELLGPGDLMEVLKDGVALCKLVNRAVSPGVKFKPSNMPFVQMENISHFLKACEMPPLSLPAHDRFLTVDLFDGKDPAQVLQCIAAFSRRANIVNPAAFPTTIGAKAKGSSMSPQNSGSNYAPKLASSPPKPPTSPPKLDTAPVTTFNSLNRGTYAGDVSPTKKSSLSRGGLATGGPVSSWSSKDDEGKTAPAWNIHQYGYMGGASQGNQGIAFGSRRQIVSTAPEVPNIAEKEKRLREKLEKEKQELEDNERRRLAEQEAEEARAREEEERKWAEETRKLREQEQMDQRREEERLRREEQARKDQGAEARMTAERNRQRTVSDPRLNGQFLSAYQAGQASAPAPVPQQSSGERQRIAELERQLAEMKAQNAERELRESQQRLQQEESQPNLPNRTQVPSTATAAGDMGTSHEDDWDAAERDYLKKAWKQEQEIANEYGPPKPPRPGNAEPLNRPLPDPMTYQPGTNRTDRFLSSNPAPVASQPRANQPSELTTQSEQDAETARRVQSQTKTKAGGWASKSLLEREMERERERQREWEEGQKQTQAAARDMKEGSGPGQTWDVHQYGYMGGDNQNRGGPGLGVGGARRQILGPRPPP